MVCKGERVPGDLGLAEEPHLQALRAGVEIQVQQPGAKEHVDLVDMRQTEETVEASDLHARIGLLQGLARGPVLGGLTALHEAGRERPETMAGLNRPPTEQNFVFPLRNAADDHLGILIVDGPALTADMALAVVAGGDEKADGGAATAAIIHVDPDRSFTECSEQIDRSHGYFQGPVVWGAQDGRRADTGARSGAGRRLPTDRLASRARRRPGRRRPQRWRGRADPGPGRSDPTDAGAIDRFCAQLQAECPPLARIDAIERGPLEFPLATDTFSIRASDATAVHTGIVPDAATCPACAAEIRDPANRRYRYPFTNCTHCGPRLSIVRGIPYDRARTSMAVFPMCPRCQAEYEDPSDRRFHAQPNACPDCGPRVWLVDADGAELAPADSGDRDAIAAASRLLDAGRILAIKGIGGFHLACDATNEEAVAELRRRKRRFAKPFALMARDLAVVRDYCRLTDQEAALLTSPAAPILLLDRHPDADARPARLASQIAPGQTTLGFMLPYSPLHHLLLMDWERPLVMTSGNLSDEPQCVDNQDARARLKPIADVSLLHDRDIVNRVDDSVVRVMAGAPRLLRRARGHAPAPLPAAARIRRSAADPRLRRRAEELRLSDPGRQAILSQHLGDLEEARTAREYEATLALYRDLFQHRPEVLAVDLHPDYRSTLIGRGLGRARGSAAGRRPAPSRPSRLRAGRQRLAARWRPGARDPARRPWSTATTAPSGAASFWWETIGAINGSGICKRSPCRAELRRFWNPGATSSRGSRPPTAGSACAPAIQTWRSRAD